MISPGLVDTHIHFRDPGFTYKEDLHTGSLAAAAGGFTSVICMANTSPVIDSVPVLKELMEREFWKTSIFSRLLLSPADSRVKR